MKTNSIETVLVKSEVTLTSGSQMAFANVGLVPGTNKGWDLLKVVVFVDNDVSVSTNTAVGAVVRRTKTAPGDDIEDVTTQDTVAMGTILDAPQSSGISNGEHGAITVMADNVVLNNLQFVVATVAGEGVTGDITVYFAAELMPVDVPQSRLIGVLTEQP